MSENATVDGGSVLAMTGRNLMTTCSRSSAFRSRRGKSLRQPYDMLRAGAAIAPDAPALTFFAEVEPVQGGDGLVAPRAVLGASPRRAIFFAASGSSAATRSPSSCRTFPETHLAIWGGEAAGIAFAISPLLEVGAIGGAFEGGRAEASGDARSGARDRSLAEGD